MMSKSCTNCDAAIPAGAAFCDNCGMPVSEAASSQAPPRKDTDQLPRALPDESTPDQGSQLEQSERLASSPVTLPSNATGSDVGEQRRGVRRRAMRAAGLVGTAARRVPRWAIGAFAGLAGMVAFQRQGADAGEENPTMDSATRQSMGVAEAVVQDPPSTGQGEADANLVREYTPVAAVTEPLASGPTLDTGLADQVEQLPDLAGPEEGEPPVGAVGKPPLVGLGAGGPPDHVLLDPAPVAEAPVGPPIDPPGPTLDPALFDPNSPGPTLDPALFDPNSLGPTLDPALFDSAGPGPNVDPSLLDEATPGPTLDPSLLDPNSPGPTLDPNLLDPNAPGPTIDPNLLDPHTPGPTLELSALLRSLVEPGGATDPGDVSALSFAEPENTEPGTPDQDFDDSMNP